MNLTPAEEEVPKFDIVVRLPPNVKLEDVERGAVAAGVPADRAATLVKALRNGPQVKIGAAVTRERADKAKAQFGAAGLAVDVTPVLALGALVTGSFDGMQVCRACNTRVMMPSNRQCPNCGAYADKMTDEALLKKRILEQEKAKLDYEAGRANKKSKASEEAELRDQIRKELESRYGKSRVSRLTGKFGTVAMLLAAFVAGMAVTPEGISFSRVQALGSSALAKTPFAGSSVAANPGGGIPGETGMASAGGLASTGDAEIDDLLKDRQSGGGKGLSIEQAVAASQKLARSVGNTTGQRGPGGEPPGRAGPAGGAPGGVAGAGGSVDGDAAARALSEPARLALAVELARQLAEMGQAQRAASIINAAKALPAMQSDATGAAAARIAEVEVRAWAVQAAPDSRRMDALMAQAKELSDPAERAQALSRAGAIVSHSPQVPPQASRAFLTEAAGNLKTIPDARRKLAAASDWVVAMGELLMAQAGTQARIGAWSRAQSADASVDELIRQAPDDAALMRLHAINYQIRQQAGQGDKAGQSLDAALALANKAGNLPERAAQLRAVARLSGAGASPRMQAALAATQAQAAGKSGVERAQALVALAVLNAEAGLRAKAAELTQLAKATTGLSAVDIAAVNADLAVRTDMADARVLHAVGMYAETEAALQRVASTLL